MKHFTLLSMAALFALQASAQTVPGVYPHYAFASISPNAKYAVSDAGDQIPLAIFDFTQESDPYTYVEQYGVGAGNAVSNNGIVVGYQVMYEKAAYWQNGKWANLPNKADLSHAQGISADGSMIVGTISGNDYSGDYEGLMSIPCYWEVQEDGTFGDPQVLPYPTEDYMGRSPQRVTAVMISEDCNTIAGQVLDYIGMVCQPIIFTRDESGEWSYTLLLDDLFHPAGFSLPEDPGEAPTQQDFMTEDEIARYQQAVKEWEEAGDQEADYPDIYEYMDQKEYDEFEKAALEWNEKYYAYAEAILNWIDAVPNFAYNNVCMDLEAQYYATTDVKYYYIEVDDYEFKECTPYLINIADDTYKSFAPKDDLNITVSAIANNGVVLGQWNDPAYGIYDGYILTPGASEFISLYDYVKANDPSLAAWMEENMTHTYEAYDENFKAYDDTVLATGLPKCCTPDMSIIGLAQVDFWNYDDDVNYYGYLINPPAPQAGIEAISAGLSAEVKVLNGGVLLVNGNVRDLNVYGLNGVKAFSAKNPASQVSTNLSKGIYILRYTDLEGRAVSRKIVIR